MVRWDRIRANHGRFGVPPSATEKIGVPSSKCGKLEFLGLSRRILCKCGRLAPRPLRPGGLRASAANSGPEVRHNGTHPCKCARLPHSVWAHNRVRCCALDHAPGLGVCALDTMLCALRCSGRYGAVGMLERSTWTRWPDRVPGVCSIGSTSRAPRGSGRALRGSLVCSNEKIGVPLYARVRTEPFGCRKPRNPSTIPTKFVQVWVICPSPPYVLADCVQVWQVQIP